MPLFSCPFSKVKRKKKKLMKIEPSPYFSLHFFHSSFTFNASYLNESTSFYFAMKGLSIL